MSGTLALAASIAAMSRAELLLLVSSRRVLSPATVHDALGLALDLLRPESLNRALSGVDRASLVALRAVGGGDGSLVDPHVLERLRLQGLLGLDEPVDTAVPLPEVTEALETALGGEMLIASCPSGSPETSDTTRWFGQALTAVRRATALLRALATQRARLSRKGAVTAASARALADAIHSDPESTAQLLGVLQLAGLAAAVESGRPSASATVLVPSAPARQWLDEPYPARWIALAGAFAAGLEPQLRQALDLAAGDLGHASRAVLHHEFPLLPSSTIDAAIEWAAVAEVLGLTVHGHLSPAAIPLLAGDPEAALAVANRDLPPPAEGVYLQPDLTLIVPGPLLPADEHALSEFTEAEQLGAAAVLRLTPSSLARAVRLGRSPEDIRALLERLSLTGIPQPLDFMLTDLNRPREGAEPTRSPGASWLSRSASSAAGGSVAGSGLGGAAADPPPNTNRATSATRITPATRGETADSEALVDRVHRAAQSQSQSGAGDLARRLELAIRDRSPIVVTAAAGGVERTFTLMPVSLTGGRLRATDQQAGVERTLPVSAITAVAPASA